MKVKYTKFEVEIGSNGHIKLNGNVIAIMGQWNKYEDIKLPTKRKK